jgi:hypothetical protein
MRLKSSSAIHTHIPKLILAALALIALPSRIAVAEDLLGLYVGAIGQSRVAANTSFTPRGFEENHTAFEVILGARPSPSLPRAIGVRG